MDPGDNPYSASDSAADSEHPHERIRRKIFAEGLSVFVGILALLTIAVAGYFFTG